MNVLKTIFTGAAAIFLGVIFIISVISLFAAGLLFIDSIEYGFNWKRSIFISVVFIGWSWFIGAVVMNKKEMEGSNENQN